MAGLWPNLLLVLRLHTIGRAPDRARPPRSRVLRVASDIRLGKVPAYIVRTVEFRKRQVIN